jgi:nitrogen fixation protein NifB
MSASVTGSPVAPSGCGATHCGADARATATLPDDIRRRVQDHPCYAEEAHRHFARMHVAVAPACNIQCNYCNRKYDCSNESRPGVVSEVLTVEQAVKKTLVVADAIPQLSVVGIAGPGDALANPKRSFDTFRALRQRAPDLRLCLSTNGLMLPQYIEEIVACAVDHVTITINCLDPDIGAQIYPWILWNKRRVSGREGAAILIDQQQKGLEMLVARGILVKVNSVLIPGINDQHLGELSSVLRAKGVFLHNVMPLISDPAHGTHFGLSGQRGPTQLELQTIQAQCAGEVRVMRHCKQCRADAVGMLGEDRSAEFTLDRIAAMEVDEAAAMQRRVALREAIKAGMANGREETDAKVHTIQPPRMLPRGRTMRMAVASRDGSSVDLHFGHAETFHIYDVDARDVRLVEQRSTPPYCAGPSACAEGSAEDKFSHNLRILADCEVMLCARVGFDPRHRLEAAGIQPICEHALESVPAALRAVWSDLQSEFRPQPLGSNRRSA